MHETMFEDRVILCHRDTIHGMILERKLARMTQQVCFAAWCGSQERRVIPPNNHSSKHRRQQSLGGALNHHSVSIRGRSPRSPTETRFEVRLTRTLTRNQVVWHLLTSAESRNHQEALKQDYMELRHFTY